MDVEMILLYLSNDSFFNSMAIFTNNLRKHTWTHAHIMTANSINPNEINDAFLYTCFDGETSSLDGGTTQRYTTHKIITGIKLKLGWGLSVNKRKG